LLSFWKGTIAEFEEVTGTLSRILEAWITERYCRLTRNWKKPNHKRAVGYSRWRSGHCLRAISRSLSIILNGGRVECNRRFPLNYFRTSSFQSSEMRYLTEREKLIHRSQGDV
jgi:hypothetical protein